MALFENQQLTDVGWDALSTALGGGRLTFYKMVAGDFDIQDLNGDGIGDDLDLPLYIELGRRVTDIAIVKYAIDGKGQITLTGLIASELIDWASGDIDGGGGINGFRFRELGVYAVIEDPGPLGGGPPFSHVTVIEGPAQHVIDLPDPGFGTPLLYSVTNAGALADYIPGNADIGATAVVNVIEVTVVIDQAQNIQVIVVPGDLTDAQNIGAGTVGPGLYRDKIGNLINLKRLIEGPQIEMDETDDTITIGIKTLTVDLDVNVFPGAPNIFPDFTTIQLAHDYLLDYHIPSNIFASIRVRAGRYLQNVPTIINHPDGSRIRIIGADLEITPFTNAGNASNVVNNSLWNFTGVGDTSGLAIDDCVTIDTTSTTIGAQSSSVGHHKVTAVGAGTLSIVARTPIIGNNANWPNGQIIKYPVQIVCNNCAGFQILSDIGLISNLSINGTTWSLTPVAGAYGIEVPTSATLSLLNVGISTGFIQGIRLLSKGVSANFYNLAISDCGIGMFVDRGAYAAVLGALIVDLYDTGLFVGIGSIVTVTQNTEVDYPNLIYYVAAASIIMWTNASAINLDGSLTLAGLIVGACNAPIIRSSAPGVMRQYSFGSVTFILAGTGTQYVVANVGATVLIDRNTPAVPIGSTLTTPLNRQLGADGSYVSLA